MALFYSTKMLCENAFLFKFVFSLENKEAIRKISLTIEATNSIQGHVSRKSRNFSGAFRVTQVSLYVQSVGIPRHETLQSS